MSALSKAAFLSFAAFLTAATAAQAVFGPAPRTTASRLRSLIGDREYYALTEPVAGIAAPCRPSRRSANALSAIAQPAKIDSRTRRTTLFFILPPGVAQFYLWQTLFMAMQLLPHGLPLTQ